MDKIESILEMYRNLDENTRAEFFRFMSWIEEQPAEELRKYDGMEPGEYYQTMKRLAGI